MPEKKPDAPLFVMAQPDTFTWPVKVRIPMNGKYAEAGFVGKFPNLTSDELDVLLGSKEDGSAKFSDREVADRVLLGFEPIAMPDGDPLVYSEEAKAMLLRQPRVATAVVGTFLAVSRGLAAEKN